MDGAARAGRRTGRRTGRCDRPSCSARGIAGGPLGAEPPRDSGAVSSCRRGPDGRSRDLSSPLAASARSQGRSPWDQRASAAGARLHARQTEPRRLGRAHERGAREVRRGAPVDRRRVGRGGAQGEDSEHGGPRGAPADGHQAPPAGSGRHGQQGVAGWQPLLGADSEPLSRSEAGVSPKERPASRVLTQPSRSTASRQKWQECTCSQARSSSAGESWPSSRALTRAPRCPITSARP